MRWARRSKAVGVGTWWRSLRVRIHWAANRRRSLTSVFITQAKDASIRLRASSKASSSRSMREVYQMRSAWLWRWGLDAIGGVLVGLILLWALAHAPVPGR